MATLELDPVFVKALRLLHSKAKDSTSQLRAMVEEVMSAKKFKTSDGDGGGKPVNRALAKEEEAKKREAEKRKFDKVRAEIIELEGMEVKKPKLESSKEDRREREKEKEKYRKEKDRRDQEREKERQEREKQKEQEREREREEKAKQKEKEASESDKTSEEEDNVTMTMDADDFAFDLGVCCEVCNKFDVTSGNRLVECQECHALYHQECHKPPVTERDVNDPRFVWYCQKCVKSMKKMAAQKPPKSKPTPPMSSGKESPSAKTNKMDPLTTTLPFKRVEVKPPTSSSKESQNLATNQPLRGLASLAANLSKPSSSKSDSSKSMQPGWKTDMGKSSHKDSTDKPPRSSDSSKSSKESKGDKSASSSSSSSSSSGAGSSTSPNSKGGGGSGGNGGKQPSLSGSTMANANKRLQLMKKNAAKKQENRVHIK